MRRAPSPEKKDLAKSVKSSLFFGFGAEEDYREVAEDEGGFSGGMPTGATKRPRHSKIGY